MPTLAERAADTALRGAVTAVTGGGIAAVLSPSSVGRMTFDSYQRSLNLEVLRPDLISTETFRDWGDQVISGLLTQGAHAGPIAILCILFVIAVIWHVLVRAAVSSDGHVPVNAAEHWYARLHGAITILIFVSLMVALLQAKRPSTMLFAFSAIIAPGIIYLAYYIKDLKNRRPFDTLVYLIVAACCTAAVLVLPMVYGEQSFDLQLATALDVDAAREPEPFEQALILDEHTGTVCTVYRKQKLTLRLEPGGHAVYGTRRASIRELAIYSSGASPAQIPAIQDVQRELDRQKGQGNRPNTPNPYVQ